MVSDYHESIQHSEDGQGEACGEVMDTETLHVVHDGVMVKPGEFLVGIEAQMTGQAYRVVAILELGRDEPSMVVVESVNVGSEEKVVGGGVDRIVTIGSQQRHRVGVVPIHLVYGDHVGHLEAVQRICQATRTIPALDNPRRIRHSVRRQVVGRNLVCILLPEWWEIFSRVGPVCKGRDDRVRKVD